MSSSKYKQAYVLMKFSLISESFLEEEQSSDTEQAVSLKGGAEVNLYHLAKLLLTKGHNVTVFQKNSGSCISEFEGINVEYIDVINFESSRAQTISFNIGWRRKVDNSSIIHIQDPVASFPFFSVVDTVNQPGINWNSPDKLPVQKYLMKVLLKNGSKVRASDNSFLSFVQAKWPALSNQVFPIPNGVDPAKFKPKQDVDTNEINVKDTSTVILFPRNLNGTHGTSLFLDCVNELQNHHNNFVAIMLGDADTKTGHCAKERASRYNIRRNLLFPGHIPNNKMVDYYNLADIVVIPTPYSEGSSIACLEAMACGKPVVTTDIGGLKDIVYRDYIDGGIKVKPIPRHLSNAVEKLMVNPKLSREIGERARERVLKYFTLDDWKKGMSSFFDNVLCDYTD